MMFPTIPVDAARQALEKRKAQEPWSGTAYVRWIGEGDKFAEAQVNVLHQKLQGLRSELALEPLPGSRARDFESPACTLVHSGLILAPHVAASREFWLWVTFVAAGGQLADLVDWRFGSQDSDFANFGVTSRSGVWEGLFARLWLRGNIGFEIGSKDPYRVARKGDIDTWRSHIIRQEYGRCRAVARALINYQFHDDGARNTLKVDELRELAKRLRIIDASMSYELLGEDMLKDLIAENVARIRDEQKIAGGAAA